jgi:hypothetical protein
MSQLRIEVVTRSTALLKEDSVYSLNSISKTRKFCLVLSLKVEREVILQLTIINYSLKLKIGIPVKGHGVV